MLSCDGVLKIDGGACKDCGLEDAVSLPVGWGAPGEVEFSDELSSFDMAKECFSSTNSFLWCLISGCSTSRLSSFYPPVDRLLLSQ